MTDELINEKILVFTTDGSTYCGIFKGTDSNANMLLQQTKLLLFSSTTSPVSPEIQTLDGVLLRGDQVALYGPYDSTDLSSPSISFPVIPY
ncbi:hypothetical protein GEMRC1_001287 [Eukaryota sp. GEM-RC1]